MGALSGLEQPQIGGNFVSYTYRNYTVMSYHIESRWFMAAQCLSLSVTWVSNYRSHLVIADKPGILDKIQIFNYNI